MEQATSYSTKIFTGWQKDRYSAVINTERDHKSGTCLARPNRTAETMANENQDKLQSHIHAVLTFAMAAAQMMVILGHHTAQQEFFLMLF
jgi:hypothetical protein